MRDKRLFFGCFAKTMCIFFLLWIVAMIAVIGVNSRWSQEEVEREKYELPNAIVQGETRLVCYPEPGVVRFLPWEEDLLSVTLTMSGCDILKEYGGQLFLRVYDNQGKRLGESQMLAGYCELGGPDGSGEVRYLLFDPAMTDEQRVEVVRFIEDYFGHRFSAGQRGAGVRVEDGELVGWEVGEVIYVQKLIWGETEVVNSSAELFPGKMPEAFHVNWVELYSPLTWGGDPKERMEQYRDMKEEVNELEKEEMERALENESVILDGTSNAALNATGAYPVAFDYRLPGGYALWGLGSTALFTLVVAVALALFTAWLEYRAIQRERAFVRGAAHELKTPLAVVRTHAEALREDIDPDKREQYLDTVVAESDRMAALVGNLLHLSRLESGQMLDKEPLDFAVLVAGRAERLTLPAEQKGIALHTQLGPAAMLGDRLALEEVVDNLLDNALGHCTPGGTVTVTLVQKGRQINLTVDNDGDLIPPEHIDHLFEPFYRGDTGRSRADGGAGLGLAIVRGAVEAHGGRCWAVNRTGGVSFTVLLPGLQSER